MTLHTPGVARAAQPPRFADPRRAGALIGLVGSCVFTFSYSVDFSDFLSAGARILVVAAVCAALWFLYAIPRYLGPFLPPRSAHIAVYVACVVAEFALIAAGSAVLEASGAPGLRPALIVLVVGLHFLPFAWAFKERMFYLLGGLLVAIGAGGLLLGTEASASTAGVSAGVVMSLVLLAYSAGAFATRVQERPPG